MTIFIVLDTFVDILYAFILDNTIFFNEEELLIIVLFIVVVVNFSTDKLVKYAFDAFIELSITTFVLINTVLFPISEFVIFPTDKLSKDAFDTFIYAVEGIVKVPTKLIELMLTFVFELPILIVLAVELPILSIVFNASKLFVETELLLVVIYIT